MKYKKIVASNGMEMFYIDGKRVPKKDIPETLLPRMDDGVEMDSVSNAPPVAESEVTKEETNLKEAPVRKCFIDGTPTNHIKFLQQKTVYVCDDHYALTTGKIVQKMREHEIIE